MLPGSVDPRRPDKQQRYKPPPASNNAAPGEDLTPDYMNILDPHRKSMQTRSDRFKVVKIESTEPFKRGRWECMDFLDQSYNRVFQRNSNKQVSSETHTHVSPVHTNNSDLQSSMLQIFYRQNNNIIENNSVGVTKPCSKEYQNHVLRPGMVSSSLVGVKYPFELNFEDKSPPTNCSTVYDCHGVCDNQKFQSMSNDFSNLTVYQNLNQDLINNGQYIEKSVQQAQNLSELYQEQIIAYVDNSPQRKVTNFLPEYDKKTNFNQQLDQQLTQIIENPISNDVPEVLYHPNPRFQEDDQYLPQTESPQNLFQNDSVISTNSCNNIKIEPQSCEQETMMLPQENLIMHTIPRCPDVKDLVACSNHNRNNQSIDDKIEQLMDLVKKHLKYAVLEDVNVMKQQILILKGRVAQLEYENALLRSFEDQSKPREDI